jgi:phosphoribosylformylglycinamidine synthase
MGQACRALDYPIISCNVSLYNETSVGGESKGIFPTPAIGGVGILLDVNKAIGNAFAQVGDEIFVVGETKGHVGSSVYLREILGREDGPPPAVDLAVEKANGDFVRSLIQAGSLTACHDVSDGGLLVALAEMTYRHGIGAKLEATGDVGFWFGEDQARYVITASAADAAKLKDQAKAANIPLSRLGATGGDALEIAGGFALKTSYLIMANEAWMPNFMAS